MRKSCVALVALSLSAFAGVSVAQAGGSLKDSPAPVVYSWSGFSFGVGLGAGTFDYDVSAEASKKGTLHCEICKKEFDIPLFHYSKESDFGDDDWKLFGTFQIAYDKQVHNRFVVGAFADIDVYKDADADFDKGSFSGSIERDYIWTIGGRLGVLATPRVLLYGLIGYSQMKLDGEVDVDFGYKSAKLDFSDTLDALTIGGGVEAKLHRGWSLKVEYRYSDFGGSSADFSKSKTFDWSKYCDLVIDKKAHVSLDDMDVHSVRAVLTYRFGEERHAAAPLK